MKIKISLGQRIFDIFNVLFMFVLMIIMFYPIWHVIVASLSDSNRLIGHIGVILKPLGFSFNAYNLMLDNPMLLKGYINTIFIVVVGTVLNLVFTSVAAYVLSRDGYMYKKLFTIMIVLTMYFSGGMIPSYLLISKTLHLNDSYASLILPVLINTYNLIIMRTSFESIPKSLEESAKLDGAGHWTTLIRIVIPLSLPIIAVMVLYYAVAHWNSWFQANLYIKTRTKYPLQLILREILIINDTTSMTGGGDAASEYSVAESVKYAVVVVATIPILCVYPFLQRFFVKGVMIGAVKG